MTFEEIVRAYQEGKDRQIAAMKKMESAMKEMSEANDAVHGCIGLMEAFLGSLGADGLLEGLLGGDNNGPRLVKSLFSGDFDGLF